MMMEQRFDDLRINQLVPNPLSIDTHTHPPGPPSPSIFPILFPPPPPTPFGKHALSHGKKVRVGDLSQIEESTVVTAAAGTGRRTPSPADGRATFPFPFPFPFSPFHQ